jgi:AraC family transcriptional regulator
MNQKVPRGNFHGETLFVRKVAGTLLAETTYMPYARISEHSHDHAYFCFVRRGIFSETVGTRTHTRGPSMLIFHPPHEEHSDSFQRLGGRCFNIQIDNSLLGYAREHGVRLEGSSHFQGGLLLSLSMRLYHEARRQDDLSDLVIEGLVLEILAEASRGQYCFSKGKPPRWLERAREIIHAHFSEQLSLASIAESVGIHRVHMARSFRQHYQCTVGDYVRRTRIEFTCRKISASDATFAEISSAAGFFDQSHFAKTFKQLTGMTPSKYRERVRSR